MASMSIQKVTVCVVLLLLTMEAVVGQNYHFSNGWHAGKKRGGEHSSCTFRKQVLNLVNKIIVDETTRIAKQCMEFIEVDAAGDAEQMTEKRWN